MGRHIGWIPFWLLLAFGTALGWLIAWTTTVSITFATGIWDPDEVEAYLERSPGQHLLEALLGGAIAGIVLAVFAGVVILLIYRHTVRDAVMPVLSIVISTSLLCGLVQVGPNALNQSSPWTAIRLGMAGGAVGGVFTGLFQWLLLHRRVPGLDRWVFLTTISWAAAWADVWSVIGWSSAPMFFGTGYLLAPAVSGALAGIGPYLGTRRIAAGRAGWLVAASAGSWIAAVLVSNLSGQVVMGALAQGLVVSGTLVALLRHALTRNKTVPAPG